MIKNLEAVRRFLDHRDYLTIKVYLDLTQEDLNKNSPSYSTSP